MSARTSRSGVVRATLGVACALAACTESAPLVSRDPEPLVYVVLSRRPWNAPPSDGAAADGALSAAVLTSGLPSRPEYRRVETFELRRLADGAVFDWRILPRSGIASPPSAAVSLHAIANVVLPASGTEGRPGRSDLIAGEYSLHVVTDGVEIDGRVRVPDDPAPRLVRDGGREVVVWAPVPGAAAYTIYGGAFLTTDTTYVVPDSGAARPTTFRMAAVDEHYARLLRNPLDQTVIRAGLSRGIGVLGAYCVAELPLPAP